MLAAMDAAISGKERTLNKLALLSEYQRYVQSQLSQGVRLHSMTRHLLSSCSGMPGARRFRQLLSDNERLKANDITLLDHALAQVFDHVA